MSPQSSSLLFLKLLRKQRIAYHHIMETGRRWLAWHRLKVKHYVEISTVCTSMCYRYVQYLLVWHPGHSYSRVGNGNVNGIKRLASRTTMHMANIIRYCQIVTTHSGHENTLTMDVRPGIAYAKGIYTSRSYPWAGTQYNSVPLLCHYNIKPGL